MKELTGYSSIDKPWLKSYDFDVDKLIIPDMSIYQMVLEYTKNYLNNVALEVRTSSNNFGKGIQLTYKDYLKKMRDFAKSLSLLGIKSSDILTTILPNIPESRVSIYGSNILGATPYSITPLIAPEKLGKIISENEIKNMFIFLPFYDKYKSVIDNSKLDNIVFVDGLESLPKPIATFYRLKNNIRIPNGRNHISYTEFTSEGRKIKEDIVPYYEKDHIALIVGTSGTTGVPKGVCLTDTNLNASAIQHMATGLFKEKDVFLDVLLQSIAYGVAAMHYTTCGGLKSVLIPELVTDKLPGLIKIINPDHFLGGPVHCLNIYNSDEFKNGEIPVIKNFVSGGASLKKDIEMGLNKVDEDFCEDGKVKRLFVRQGLGSTENTGGGFYAMPGTYKFGGVGIPLPLVNAGIFKPGTDEELPYGMEGELCLTGPTVMKEYLNNKDETNKVLKIHKDGKIWLHMGDLGIMDKDGQFFHKYRISNIFMRKGFNVHPGKINEFLESLPMIKNCGVIAVEHPLEEMVPIAFISLNKEYKSKEDEVKYAIEDLCNKNLDEPAIPFKYIYLEDLPLNAGGKVNLPLLKEIYESQYRDIKLVLKK